ncbi:bacteriohopanetetrol glucosamine biosynthesis glycosyltransferase HpnI [Bradyrhizobium liaoningense]
MFEIVAVATIAACVAISIGSLCYLLLAIWCVSSLPPKGGDVSVRVPATTVLKPLCGDEPQLREALLSFVTQDFPAPLQLIFGVRSPTDSALPIARDLQAQHPHLDIEIVIDPAVHGPNFKASNLINMMRFAKHDMIVVSDSDIVIGPDHLRQITAHLAASSATIVTCLYRGAPAHPESWVNQLGALYIDAWYLPAAAVDGIMFGVTACYSPLMALRREFVATELDNFRALATTIGDDAHIGRIARERGRKIELAPFLVLTTIPETRLGQLFLHELRWARTMRVLRPGECLGLIFTHALPVALLMIALYPGAATALLFGSIAALRGLLLATVEARVGRAPTARTPTPWFLMLREFIYFGVWLWAFASRTIIYRGRKLSVQPGGHIAAEDFIAAGLPAADQRLAG